MRRCHSKSSYNIKLRCRLYYVVQCNHLERLGSERCRRKRSLATVKTRRTHQCNKGEQYDEMAYLYTDKSSMKNCITAVQKTPLAMFQVMLYPFVAVYILHRFTRQQCTCLQVVNLIQEKQDFQFNTLEGVLDYM